MTMSKSRRASPGNKAFSPLPDIVGTWSESDIAAETDAILRELEDAAAGASSAAAANSQQIVSIAAWIISQKLRTEEWLRIAFERIVLLERELRKVKAAPTLSYKGAWKQGQETLPGEFVTFQGSVWHCNKKSLSRPGDDPGAYTLAVKAGRDGKDARP